MYCLQLVEDGTLILTLFPTPGAVGQPIEAVHSTSGSCMLVNSITFGDSDVDTTLKNFSPFD